MLVESAHHVANLPNGTIMGKPNVLLFGQEGPGLSAEAREASEQTLSIAQFGSTRSINAGAAAAIAMHAWIRQHATP